MAAKPKTLPNARLDQLSKAELIRTVKTLRTRETKLLNMVTKLNEQHAKLDTLKAGDKLIVFTDDVAPAVPTFPWEQA